MVLRPGNAGLEHVRRPRSGLAAAIRQIPARVPAELLVRVDGAGASHELIKHLLAS